MTPGSMTQLAHAIPPTGINPKFCFVDGSRSLAAPEPSTAALAIPAAAMLVTWTVLEKAVFYQD
jgi:hypothetical protein